MSFDVSGDDTRTHFTHHVKLDFGVADGHRDSNGAHFTPIDGPTLETLTRSLDDRAVTMPFVSQAQRQWMHIHHPDMAKRWESHTPKGAKLPRHVSASDRVGGEAAIIVVDNGNGMVLSVSRRASLDDLGFPGGMVEENERPIDAAVRELYEETGVDAKTCELVFSAPATDDPTRTVHVFRAAAHDTDILGIPETTPEPGTLVCWVLPSELLNESNTFAEFARRHFEQLFGHLRGLTMTTQLADITTKQRKGLSGDQFADPANRKYPIPDAAHVRNAAARLEQQKGSMSSAEYKAIRGRIAAAAKRFGIKSEYNKPKAKGERTGSTHRIHIRADLAPGGQLHVGHHMMSDKQGRERSAYVLRTSGSIEPGDIKLCAEDGERPKRLVWIQLAEVGAFRGHPAGQFALTPTVFSEIVRNFEREGLPIPIDYEHASESDPTSGGIPIHGAPAQGWIHKLDNRGPAGLWGLVEWRPQAAAQIKAGEYRYISPAIRFGAKDRNSGEDIGAKLTSAGLTNQPFLKGMQALAAKDRGAAGEAHALADSTTMQTLAGDDVDADSAAMAAFAAYRDARMAAFSNFGAFAAKPNDYMPQIKAALKLPDLATASETMKQFRRLRDRMKFPSEASGAGGAPSAESADGVSASDYFKPLRDIAAKDNLAATVEHVLDVVHHMICVAMEKHELEMHIDQLAQEDADEDAEMSSMMNDLAKGADLAAFGDKETTQPPQGTQPPPGDTHMSDTIKLSDHQAAISAKDSEIAGLKTRVDSAELQLTTEKGKVTEMTAKLTDLEGRESARLLKDLETEADAIVANPDNHLAAEHKPRVLKLLKDSPETTREMWKPSAKAVAPLLPSNLVHLSQRLPPPPRAGAVGGPTATQPQRGEPVFVTESGAEIDARILSERIPETTHRLQQEDPNLSYAAAQQKAQDLHNEARKHVHTG